MCGRTGLLHVAGDEAGADGDAKLFAVFVEFPVVHGAVGETMTDAIVIQQLARVLGLRVFGKVGGRRHDGEALGAGDIDGDHVLVQRLAQPNTAVEILGNDVGEHVVTAEYPKVLCPPAR